jgi:hypothetical protein
VVVVLLVSAAQAGVVVPAVVVHLQLVRMVQVIVPKELVKLQVREVMVLLMI